MPIVVPAVANVTGWVFMLSPGPGYLNALLRKLPWWNDLESGPIDIYTMPWIVILTGLGLTAFVYLFVSAGLRNINGELIEAAMASGSSATGVFFRVTVPLLRPVLLYGGGVALLLGLGQFTAPLLLGRNAGINVLTTDIYRSVSQSPIDYSVAAAIASPLIVIGLCVVVFQRIALGDQRRFVTHGGKSFRAQARPSKLAAAALIAYGTLATLLPVGALVIVSLSPFWSETIPWGEFTLDNFRRIFEEARVTEAIVTSLVVSLVAVAIALPVGFVVSSLLLRSRISGWHRTTLDLVVALPLGIPAVVFGAAFLLEYTRGPFILYGSRWVVILVYLVLMLPFTTRMQMSGMLALGESYIEASRVSGASAWRTNWKILRAADAGHDRRRGRAHVRAADARVHGVSAGPLVDDADDGDRPLRLLVQRLLPRGRRDRPGDDRGHAGRGDRRLRDRWRRRAEQALMPSFGLTAFSTDESADPGQIAAAAEAAGFCLLLFPDHTHVPVSRRTPYPGGGDDAGPLPPHARPARRQRLGRLGVASTCASASACAWCRRATRSSSPSRWPAST